MRKPTFSAAAVHQFVMRHQIADLKQIKEALGCTVDVPIFRKLRELDHLTSYSHRGRYYTLSEIARFDDDGLWLYQSVWFSRYGTLLNTAESFVNQSAAGYFAEELAESLHVEVHDALLQLVPLSEVYEAAGRENSWPTGSLCFLSIHGGTLVTVPIPVPIPFFEMDFPSDIRISRI